MRIGHRRHLTALPGTGERIMPRTPTGPLTEITDDEKTESMAMFVITTGRDTLLRLRAAQDDPDAMSALLRSLSDRELAGADVCAGVDPKRDAFVSRMIIYEDGRRAGFAEAMGGAA